MIASQKHIFFDHERLDVYQKSLVLVAWTSVFLERVPKKLAAYAQLDRASTSIPLNIAEGNGRFTAPDRCRFFDNARGSALECAACLDVLVKRGVIEVAEITEGKELLEDIVSMLFRLIRSNSTSRVYEDDGQYGSPLDFKEMSKKPPHA